MLATQLYAIYLISAGGLHGKGLGGLDDSVFNERQGGNHGNTFLCSKSTSSKFCLTLIQYM